MSSHYIYLACTWPGCEKTASIYTGNIYLDEFPDAGDGSFEGETLYVRCNEHLDKEPPMTEAPQVTPPYKVVKIKWRKATVKHLAKIARKHGFKLSEVQVDWDYIDIDDNIALFLKLGTPPPRPLSPLYSTFAPNDGEFIPSDIFDPNIIDLPEEPFDARS